ncbi:MAG: hypothetical protein Q4B73_10370, partial [Lachnospiraceae bacterium]|nr:hypothetical protein [Lachnospiraceae bacterium]
YGHYEGHDRNSDGPFFECRARVININYGHNEEILKACAILNQYAQFVAMVRTLQKGYNENEEVIKKDILGVIDECIEKDILSDFLRKYRAEVAMSILTEFDVEKWKKTMREDGYYEGKADGLAEGRAAGLEEGRAEGKAEGLFLAAWKAFESKLMTAEVAASLAGLEVSEFLEKGRDLTHQA